MRSQPNRDYISDDVVQTPVRLAYRLVEHFQPRGRVLEPCKGRGNFLRALQASVGSTGRVDWCEIKLGRDFFAWSEPVNWIMTNPPWSKVRRFLQHAMQVADDIVFLVTINHVWTRARVNDIRNAGFGLREIVLLDMPSSFPQSGFQLGAVHFVRGWKGATKLTDWTRATLTLIKAAAATSSAVAVKDTTRPALRPRSPAQRNRSQRRGRKLRAD